ncbi:MAG: MCE family protein [Candidatus Omnitrophica bacterium]|nr:MCE family protein [Candidatus Omnitrophota bacterium]
MSKKANKTLIGAFVVGAIALLVLGLAVFGSGKLFSKTNKYVLFFEGSVRGLALGAPVTFKGVKIGTVKDISLVFDPESRFAFIPVIIETTPQLIKDAPLQRDSKNVQYLIQNGLRAQLDMQSLLTGQLAVSLDFFPDKPARLLGLMKEYTEIPTIQSPFGELQKNIGEIPLKDIAFNLQESTRSLNIALKETRETLIFDIENTLREVTQAARSVRLLAEYLEQHPEALIKGKKEN